MTIETKAQLFEELSKESADPLDKIIVWNIPLNLLRQWMKEDIEDNNYFFKKLNEFEERISKLEK